MNADDVDRTEAEVSAALSDSDIEHGNHEDSEMHIKEEHSAAGPSAEGSGDQKKKLDAKDPLRPRRKKARRACHACQRAHLTCGDERPCQRCVKRGLADACQDGVRKKAKYLHDAPAEVLRPLLGPGYEAGQAKARPLPHANCHASHAASDMSTVGSAFFSQSSAPSYPVFVAAQTSLASMPDARQAFGSQQAAMSPTLPSSTPPMSGITIPPRAAAEMASFSSPLYGPSNATLFNFDLGSLNFESQYGAMEFGILGQMSSGAGQADTPPRDPSVSQPGAGEMAFASAGNFGSGLNGYDSGMGDFGSLDQRAHGLYSQGNLQHGLPHAYAIPAGPTNLQSPSTENDSPQLTPYPYNDGSPAPPHFSAPNGQVNNSHGSNRAKAKCLTRLGQHAILGKRQRDPSYIYETVKEPFPYVGSFHKLISLLKTRFSPAKTQRIAKSLASIRPPFISCTRTLNSQDLVFMEKCFQRALFEYEEFSHQCSSACVVCRRTGEVAWANHQFTALTSWTRNVLLGKETNKNVNTGGGPSPSTEHGNNESNAGDWAVSNLLMRNLNLQSMQSQRQPVFLAELMDDDSVIDFYDDYAELAFNNSRGTTTRTCRVLKYQTAEPATNNAAITSPRAAMNPRSCILSHRVATIGGEHGIAKLDKDGKIDCTYTWTIKRDTFDIPMMIVVNFLPRSNGHMAV